jgi:hypothetical protein
MDQPHAVVKIRVNHHATPGPSRAASLRLNQELLPLPEQADLKEAATNFARIRPERAVFQLSTEFYHTTSRTETYYSTESYACGTTSGPYSSTRYCSRSVTKYRTVTDRVSDAHCKRTVAFTPQIGTLYLMQYDFYGQDECSLKCFIQTPEEGGEFSLSPCPPSPSPPPTPDR